MRKGRIYGYQQLEQSDCGITCVRIIARYFGYRYTPAFLRGLSDSSRLGISIKDMTQTFAGIGFRAIPVRIGIDKLSEMPLPAILYWNQNHFIVLYRISKGRYHIVDPGSGKTSFRRSDIETYWLSGSNTGLAILAEPDPEAKPVECPREKSVSAIATLLRLFGQCLGNNRKPFAAVMMLSLISMCADIAMPLIFQQTVDTGISTGDIGLVWLLALMQVMIFIGNFMSSSALQYVITRLGLSLGISMMNEYLSRLLSMSMSFFARKVSSDLIQKIHDQERIKDFMVSMPGMLFTTALSMIVFSAMLAYYCLPALLIMTGATLLGIMWNNAFLRHTREIDFSRFSALSKSRNHVYEIVNGIAEIKINGAEEMRLGVWRRLQLKIRDLSVRALKIELLSSGGTSLITKLQDVCITGICATMVIRGEMTIGMMMTVGYITGRLAIPFANVVSMCRSVQKTTMAVERVDEVMNHTPVRPADTACMPPADITLKNVWFRYPGSQNPDVLRHVSLSIRKGSTIAIVGASGGGKTTLIKIILGLFMPHTGEVEIGGRPLTADNAGAWMKNCAAVMQDGIIFSGTILSNIAISDEHPDMAKVQEAIETACLGSFIANLPMGLMTRIGVAGIELSGGQKQRLLVARAVYRNPGVLILDEATSSLDAENEASIVRNINRFKQGRTVIIVAHRLSTVKNADRIIFLRNGEIIETGTHRELVDYGGGYFQLISNQLEIAN